jgi:hypothetical protein
MKVRLESLRTTSITLITRCRHGDTSAWEEGVYAGKCGPTGFCQGGVKKVILFFFYTHAHV